MTNLFKSLLCIASLIQIKSTVIRNFFTGKLFVNRNIYGKYMGTMWNERLYNMKYLRTKIMRLQYSIISHTFYSKLKTLIHLVKFFAITTSTLLYW